jgi:hypothetical protein
MAAIGLVAMVAAAPAPSEAADAAGRVIVIRMQNLCMLTPIEIQKAQSVAGEIYKKIGVSVAWLEASEEVPTPLREALNLRVALLSGEHTSRMIGERNLAAGVLGVAPPGVSAVYLFCRRIEDAASTMRRRVELVLGRVLAHEIGHQLLPQQGHSIAGIMKAQLALDGLAPGFTNQQRESILGLLAHSANRAAANAREPEWLTSMDAGSGHSVGGSYAHR